ncbi:hypothetical protein FGG08_001100 [Glutinoglossum americanum]|uniref:Uncharacterized protein n=1 Tax=Glutinoglossum americanum TaxID=1670608 RepID=A0A9P8IH98_9PEZI|nr:hypothetical protein FGG08_001100 [Glutinoglossum americanum]
MSALEWYLIAIFHRTWLGIELTLTHKISDATINNSRSFGSLFKDNAQPNIGDLTLAQQGGLITVHGTLGNYLGLLDPRTSKAITNLAENYFVHVEAYCLQNPDPSKRQATISINLYGLSENIGEVGDILFNNGVFLQLPSKYDPKVEYRNPQSLEIPKGALGRFGNVDRRAKSQRIYDMKGDLTDFLATITKEMAFEDCPVSTRLKTPLLKHQKQGLSFMRAKESELCGPKDAIPDSTRTLLPGPIRHVRPGCLNVLIYHGSRGKIDLDKIGMSDVVLTTYSTVVSEWTKQESLLHQKQWFRIILDEAHFLRERSTRRFRAICALKGERRWALTGTPVQNRIDDLSGLLIFLKISPFHNHAEFRDQISKPLQMGSLDGLYRLRSLLSSIALRRTREIIELPPRHEVIEELELSVKERHIYEVFRDESRALIDTMLGTEDYTSRFSMIQSILRQRQVCNHGTELLPAKVRARLDRRCRVQLLEGNSMPEQGFPIFCEGCDNEIDVTESNQGTFVSCFHVVCPRCLNSTDPDATNACPLCGVNDTEIQGGKRKVNSISEWLNQLDYSGPSTKVMALIENIRSSQEPGSSEPVKSIVFSSWSRMLLLVEKAFKDCNIPCTRFDGTLSLEARKKVLDDFQTKSGTTILLITLGSGSVGTDSLNLTAASHVHLLDIQWNPQAERQALDRVHRLGQRNPVKTVRYIVKDSIDGAILDLQRKKLNMAELSLSSVEARGTNQTKKRLMVSYLSGLQSRFSNIADEFAGSPCGV